jgi:hypothetical protein
VNPKTNPTDPNPNISRRVLSTSLAPADVMKISGNDLVLSEETTTERNSVLVLYEAMSKIDKMIKP